MATLINKPPDIGKHRPVNALILSDVHAPYHSRAWLNRAVRFGERAKGDFVCILAGDTCDFSSLSSHAPHESPPTLKSEINSARTVIRRLADSFKHVYVTLGNHEFRATRTLKEWTPEMVMESLINGAQNNVCEPLLVQLA